MNIDFEKELNAEQYNAATGPDGPLLVLAAAGTGKTRTLVYRVAYLVDARTPPDRILLLTFTNRAAHEMLERAREVAGPQAGGVWGGTFHHFANRLLRRHAPRLDYPCDYTILDRDESVTLVKQCAQALRLHSKDFPRPAVLLGLHSTAVNADQDLDDTVRARYSEHWVDPDDIVRVLHAYAKRKRELNAMDFDDLLVNARDLLRRDSGLEARYQEQFRHVLVDEYQDTNPIQAELVDRLAARHRNVLVVGDDFQCIYTWRGADFRNIMSFPERYPDTRIFKLETNYRSVPEILNVANACIAMNKDQFQKTLRPTRTSSHKPSVVHLDNGDAQADYVIEQIHLLRREGYPYRDMAILYRAHYHAMEMELALRRSGIPYFVTSGMRFFEQSHVKDACCMLRLWRSPSDEMAFVRIVQWLPKVGVKTAEKIWRKMGGSFRAQDPEQHARVAELLPAPARTGWTDIVSAWGGAIHDHLDDKPGAILDLFRTSFYNRHAELVFDNPDKRLEDIEGLIQYLAKFDDLGDFLSEAALLTNLDAESEPMDASPEESLRLSTVHQAKGLEWPVVFILWLAEGLFPSGRALEESADASEERRLFYVATTRAKDELRLCVPLARRNRDGSPTFYSPSRFVNELSSDLTERVRAGFR